MKDDSIKNEKWQNIMVKAKENFNKDFKNWTSWTTNDYGSWVKNMEVQASQPKIEEAEMIEKILANTDDKGFFLDVANWIRSVAPRKIEWFLRELYLGTQSYDKMCELIYRLGFRASEIIERRMILGPNNKWVQLYFKDFPVGD